MSKPRYRWWGYVKNVIYAYPYLKSQCEAPVHMPITAQHSLTPPKTGAERKIENAVSKRVSSNDYAEYEAVLKTVRETVRLDTGEARLTIIDLVYWKRSHTLAGAGMQVGYSYRQARRMQGQFIKLVAKNLGIFDEDGPQGPKTHDNLVS